MIFVTTLFDGKLRRILTTDQLAFMGIKNLTWQQRTELTQMIWDNKRRVYGFLQAEALMQQLVAKFDKNVRLRQLGRTDERNNERAHTYEETELSLNEFFNESYALNEVYKVMLRAVQEGIVDQRYAWVKLTFADVPEDEVGYVNARIFMTDILFPRLSLRSNLKDRVLKRVYHGDTPIDTTYRSYREKFLEPRSGPTRRGRKDDVQNLGFDKPGIMTPSTEDVLGVKPLSVDKSLERKKPGKLFFTAPSSHETDLMNDAEALRQAGRFPFGAGPSGSIAYDLAVYHYYLVVWRGVDERSDEFAERMLMFGISRALGYVKYGHHSLFEALIPLQKLVEKRRSNAFGSPEKLYAFVIPFIEHGIRQNKRSHGEEVVHKFHKSYPVHWDQYISDWLDLRVYGPKLYEHWTIRKVSGSPVGLNGLAIAPGRYIYVVLMADKSFRYLPTSPDGEQYRSHSQLAGGVSVLAAGYFKVGENGRIRWIDNASGHYRPDPDSVEYARDRLTKLGFDTSQTNLRTHKPNSSDTDWFPWAKRQTLYFARIVYANSRTMIGARNDRYRSFPRPPPDLEPYMPYSW